MAAFRRQHHQQLLHDHPVGQGALSASSCMTLERTLRTGIEGLQRLRLRPLPSLQVVLMQGLSSASLLERASTDRSKDLRNLIIVSRTTTLLSAFRRQTGSRTSMRTLRASMRGMIIIIIVIIMVARITITILLLLLPPRHTTTLTLTILLLRLTITTTIITTKDIQEDTLPFAEGEALAPDTHLDRLLIIITDPLNHRLLIHMDRPITLCRTTTGMVEEDTVRRIIPATLTSVERPVKGITLRQNTTRTLIGL